MPAFDALLTAWGALAAAAWAAACLGGLWIACRFRRMSDWNPPDPARWPRVSIVVPVRNEADHLEAALGTLLAEDYPDLEVIAVDDRSDDATGRLLDRIAAAAPRLRAVHVRHVPDGWLGKVHALHVGCRSARGEFLLFTDADVHLAKGTLRKAIAVCESRGVDHLALAPRVESPGFVQEVVNAAFVTAFLLGTHATEVAKPGSRRYVGIGAFNLVRRSTFDRTPGFDWLRMEVLDDVGLGLMLHRAGARKEFAFGIDELHLTWYPSLAAMARGLEKNLFAAVARYSWVRVAGWLAVAVASSGGLAAALSPAAPLQVKGLALGALSVLALAACVLRARARAPLLPTLLAPVGALVLTALLVRSAVLCTRRGGIRWRDTLYPIDALKAGQRVKL